MVMTGKFKKEQVVYIYHDDRDWWVRKTGVYWWHCRANGDTWLPGLPIGLTVDDVRLLIE